LVRAVDSSTRTFTLYGIYNGRTYYAVAASSTEMKDGYGNNLVFAEFRPGDVVDVTYVENDQVLTSIRQSSAARTFTNQTVSVDTANTRITRGNTSYIYGQELVAVQRGEPFDIEKITAADRVTMRVINNVCVFVEITSGHGVIDVLFNEHIKNGNIAIGTETYSKLDKDMQFPVSEATHTVVIKGDNIEDIVRDVMVRNGETAVIDLADAQFKRGVIFFTSNIDNVYLTVNDREWDIGTPLPLEYGTYSIRGTAMGYQAHERTIELRVPQLEYAVTMDPLPTPTPRPERVDTFRLNITTNVGGAEVFIDGHYAGMTPDYA
jgi:hypothetical protein